MNTTHEETPQAGPSASPPPPPWGQAWSNPHHKSPVLAGVLSGSMPGLGQVYLGYYTRGLVHVLVFASLIAMLSTGFADHGFEPLVGIGIGFFYFYNIVDAVRRASLYNHALAGMMPVQMPEDFKLPSGRSSLFGGILLTAAGFVLLLNTRFDFDMHWLADWWPAIIVLFGLNIVYKAWKARNT